MKINMEEIKQRTVSVNQYIENIGEPFRQQFLERKRTYRLNTEAIDKLRSLASSIVVVAFSAEWCRDCAANIPVLALISETIGLEVRIFGGLKMDPLNPSRKWSIPPSPPEVEKFHVDKIPLILVFNKEGTELGRIIENPMEGSTLEDILQVVLESSVKCRTKP